jgi:hypothetical protein
MTLQNRVTPFGEIVAVAARGTLMVNRGCLHDDERQVVRTSARVSWVTCRLEWNGIRRPIMAPGKYTELFFLDEATALAAGHRPCGDCRAERLIEFERAWAAGVEGRPGEVALVQAIDPVMKRDRAERNGAQRRFTARAGGLPDGVMVQLPAEEGTARLKWQGRYLKWTPGGYGRQKPVEAKTTVMVLTPACTVKVLAAGYVPEVHASATPVS